MYFKKTVLAVWTLFFCWYLMCWPDQSWAGQTLEPEIGAQSALLMDVENGQILYQRNHLQPRPMASTTKVMTAIIALAGADVQSTVTVSPRAATVGEASMYLVAGERLSLEQLLYGALVRSGNDACLALAEHVAGSEEAFILLMNEKAVLLGARDTKFSNTNGLPVAQHQSTAMDLALITRYALLDPYFNQIIKTKSIKIAGSGGQIHYLKNTNQLLWRYPGADGVKTGTTVAAGKCLIATASKADRRLLVVLLNSPDRFNDATRLLDYGFQEFKKENLVHQGELFASVGVVNGVNASVPVAIHDSITVNMRVDGSDQIEKKVQLVSTIHAPVTKGQALGELSVLINGVKVDSTRLVADATVQELSGLRKWLYQLKAGLDTELTRPKSPASTGGGCQRAVKSSIDSTNIQRGLKPFSE